MSQACNRHRFSIVAILWAGLFAVLLLVLSYLPRERPAAVTGESSLFKNKKRTPVTFAYGAACNLQVNSGGWIHLPYVRCEESTVSVATCGANHTDNWQFGSEARQCGARRLSSSQAQALLKQKWIVMAGDSITRFLFAALLRLLANSDEQKIVFGHQDFEYTLPGKIKASFLWSPYTANITGHLQQWCRTLQSSTCRAHLLCPQGCKRVLTIALGICTLAFCIPIWHMLCRTKARTQPDMVVISTGLWHILHISDPEGYTEALDTLSLLSHAFLNSQASNPIFMHFLSITEVYPPKLKTEEKRQALTLGNVDLYNQRIKSSHVIQPEGPFDLIDMHHLTQGCGPDCTHDGLHYSNATYDAALQIWLNSLLIE